MSDDLCALDAHPDYWRWREVASEQTTRAEVAEAQVAALLEALEDLTFTFAAALKTCGGGVVIQPRLTRELPRDTVIQRTEYPDGSVQYAALVPTPEGRS